MDIRAEIQTVYRAAFAESGDRTVAYMTACDRFADLAGYVPPAATLDRLLQGVVLGRDHPLMRLLQVPPVRVGD